MYAVHMGKWERINSLVTAVAVGMTVAILFSWLVGGRFGGPVVVACLSIVTVCVLEMLAFAFFGPDEAEEGDEDE